MSGLLVKHLLWRVSSTLMDNRPQFKRYAERDMVIALQAGVRALCKYLPHAGARTIAMRLQPGSLQSVAKIPAARVKTYDGSDPWEVFATGIFDVIRNMGANGVTPGRAITIAERGRLDRIDPLWHSKSGEVVRQFTYNPQDPTSFYVAPAVPAAPEVWVDVSLPAPPKPVTAGNAPGSERYAYSGSNTDLVGLDDQYEDELWNYCCAYLLMSEAKAQGALTRASMHIQAFNASINSMAQQATGHNPNLKALPFAPEPAGAAS